MRINEITIKNFKAIYNATLELSDFNADNYWTRRLHVY